MGENNTPTALKGCGVKTVLQQEIEVALSAGMKFHLFTLLTLFWPFIINGVLVICQTIAHQKIVQSDWM